MTGTRAMVVGVAVLAVLTGGKEPTEFTVPQVKLGLLFDSVREQILDAQARARSAPGDAQAIGDLGVLYFVENLGKTAARCFERAAELSPQAMRWHYYAALSYEEAEETDHAVAAYERALAVRSYAPACVKLANILIETDVERAEILFKRSLELNGEPAEAHFGLGRCEAVRSNREEAIVHFRQALKLEPAYAAAHYELAMLLRATGATEQAHEHLRRFQAVGEPRAAVDPLMRVLKTRRRDATFQIASLSKLFTASLMMALEQDGALRADDNVDDYLDDVKAPSAGYGRAMRLVDLATHTSGLPPNPPNRRDRPNSPTVMEPY